jgi:protoheme IX farnesyltransferase
VKAAAVPSVRSIAQDFLELTKPRLTLFVLIVVFVSGYLAAGRHIDFFVLLNAISGAALVGGGASALNMLLEREHDAKMQRTWSRPLADGRLQPREVLLFGCALSSLGILQLLLATTPLAALCAAATLALYVGVYTPLKRITTLNTHIGALPGALPALLGAAAVTGSLPPSAWALFLIVFLWQIPHFLSIAWLHREDYARGGFRMLPVIDPDGSATGRQAVVGTLALIPVSLLPALLNVSGPSSAVGALVLGALFLRRSLQFAWTRSQESARRLMRASLLYLPLLLGLLLLDGGL